MKKISSLLVICTLLVAAIPMDGYAQRRKEKQNTDPVVDQKIYKELNYRLVGPFRGGRSAAVTGVDGNGKMFYMGSTGGGVWKTENAGETWSNVSDGFFGGTIGAVEVAKSDNNIVFAAGGEKTIRGNVSHGYGIWKSVDGGENWEYKGLKECQYIPRLKIHPSNPDLVYAAALGHLFGPNPERGIYRSKDGGDSWEKILFVNENAGGVDLILDPSNPRIIYASTWRVHRTPYSLESGGDGSALWISRDSGDTWTKISDSPGMPGGEHGIIGVTLSKANPQKIYAMVEAKQGGLFVSDDRGKNWRLVNSDRSLRQRAWYYTRCYADPNDAEIVYVLNVGFNKSTDGGKTFSSIRTPHGDHHDLWIDPTDSKVMIIGDDGGAQVTLDGGEQWSSADNQPTAQFYRVATDNHFPYRIYGGQQDNSTVRIESRAIGSGGIGEDNWESTAGGESGWIAPDPDDSDIVYGGSYGGYLVRINHKTGERRRVDPWPDNPMGWGADSLKERFQWNFPILFSIHDNNTLYTSSNRLFKTENEGQSWTIMSPDLTRNDKSKMGPSGGPITKDNTSIEYYGTIFAIAESKLDKGVIWCGSDDGLIHITRDNGQNWEDVSPPTNLMPEWTMINSVEADPFNAGGLFVAATAYKLDDFSPYLFYTNDYGRTWKKIITGIDKSHFTRVIRADSKREGMLFSGTESGMYISFDNGNLWQAFQNNLPVVPITDLAIKNNELIVATQGRAFWSFDYLNILRKADDKMLSSDIVMLNPEPAHRLPGGRSFRGTSLSMGQNPPSGVVFNFFLNNGIEKEEFKLDIIDPQGNIAKSFFSGTKAEVKSHLPNQKVKLVEGFNQVSWNMSYPGALRVDGMILWAGSLGGPRAVPGIYTANLSIGSKESNVEFEVLANPLGSSKNEDLQAQFDFLIEVRDKLTEVHQAILDIRTMRKDLSDLQNKLEESRDAELIKKIRAVSTSLSDIENELYQTKNRSSQDPLNFPIKLGNKLAALNGVAGTGDYRPTDQAYEVRDQLVKRIDIQLNKLAALRDTDIEGLNKELIDLKLPYIKK